MKKVLLLGLLGLGACATSADHSDSVMSDGSTVHTIRCENSWDGCYLAASRICRDGGFVEIERSSTGALDAAGRLERMHAIEGGIEDHRYSENAQETVFDRVIMIRCNGREPAPASQ
jgi:hypothetical protein